jgi:hypothetical protein
MSPSQLKEIFHVDDINLVPNYEIVKLVHHTNHHSINKRSIDSNNLFNSNTKNSFSINSDSVSDKKSVSKNNHHVKKDLSKIPYFDKSEYNEKSLNSNRNNENIKYNLKNNNNVKQHNVSFSAFGDVLNLTLTPTEGLFKNGPNSLKMWNVRSDPNATQGLVYEEVEEVSAHLFFLYKFQKPFKFARFRSNIK